ncbi:ASCH domain-containing protein, partial [Anaerolineales bacterium HSG24]|nr:ASCH domain-containing protein [Anaerolineales bacterium HSG24]
GTASLQSSYLANEPTPKIGDISIIINWSNVPQCIIETIKIEIFKFKDVPAEFARVEGEGDKSLEYWKNVHQDAFNREAEALGIEFTKDSLVICEEFKLIYNQ